VGYRSNELASAAQAWTDKCAYGHGGGEPVNAGENIAAYFGGGSDVAGAIGMWSSKLTLSSGLFDSETDSIGLSRSFMLDEAKDYNWGAPAYNGSTGHFTQQVRRRLLQLVDSCLTKEVGGEQVWKSTTEIGCAETLCSSLTFTYQAPWVSLFPSPWKLSRSQQPTFRARFREKCCRISQSFAYSCIVY